MYHDTIHVRDGFSLKPLIHRGELFLLNIVRMVVNIPEQDQFSPDPISLHFPVKQILGLNNPVLIITPRIVDNLVSFFSFYLPLICRIVILFQDSQIKTGIGLRLKISLILKKGGP